MKTINKIMLIQLAFLIGGIIKFYCLKYNLSNIITTHIILTIGYLLGYLHSKRKY